MEEQNNENQNQISETNKTYAKDTMNKYKELIFKLMMILLDKYGVMVVDWMGFLLGLNRDNKPISKQSVDEIVQSLKELNDKLKDPRVQEQLILAIKESEPILREGLITMLKVGTAGANFVIRDMITLVCNESPAAPICGIFKLMGNTIDFGNELLESTNKSLDIYQDAKKWVDNLQSKMETINQVSTGLKDKGNLYTKDVQNYGNKVSSLAKDQMNMMNQYGQKKLDKYGMLIPDSQKYKQSLNQINTGIQSQVDKANTQFQKSTNELNQSLSNAADSVTKKVDDYKQKIPTTSNLIQRGGKYKTKSKNKGIIKRRTKKSIYKFKSQF